MFGISEIVIILIVVILVVGAKKLPELARSAGRSARILKSETKAMKQDGTEVGTPTYTVTDAPHPQGPQTAQDKQGEQNTQDARGSQEPPRA
ncbi:Sec-independent protein translocase subunit TatA [Streptomyces sp. ODS28]|uniref:Sec-independent protein translocase subunit TatA n=1 Tax=Streptomyces sp. ODS28 TaxID=3136688 RepID=UPI0031EE62EF